MSKPIAVPYEEFLRLFEQETNDVEGTNLLQTPNSTVIRCIQQLHGKSGLIVKLEQDLIATHPELRHRPADPQVGTFEIHATQEETTMNEPVYLGDGVYAQWEGDMVKLTTEDGVSTTNTIFLGAGSFCGPGAVRQKRRKGNLLKQ